MIWPCYEIGTAHGKFTREDKLACEKYLESEGLNWTSIRPVYIYGLSDVCDTK